MKITSIAPWFGSKRTMAPEIIRQLGPHSYYFELCCGSMAVLLAKEEASHELVCDRHGGLTNLAWVVQNEDTGYELFGRLSRVTMGDALYQRSKEWVDAFEEARHVAPADNPDVRWAYHYFIASWMGRNGVAGTQRVNYQIATRWTKGGGSGPTRFRNAVESIPAWFHRLRNVHILRRSVFDVLPNIHDDDGVAIYADPPYLHGTMAGNARYLFDFRDLDHSRLAMELARFKKARVVVSYYDSPFLADLYPGWKKMDCSRHKHLHVQNKRGMGRKEAPEVLMVNGNLF